MLINDKEAVARLESPFNLINRLRRINEGESSKKNNAMSLFGIGRKSSAESIVREPKPVRRESDESILSVTTAPINFNPFQAPETISGGGGGDGGNEQPKHTPSLDNIIENHESQIKLGLAHDNALNLLVNSVNMLSAKLEDVSASKLPAVISAASKTVESIRRERNESAKSNKDREVHYHFYTPQQQAVSDYEIIDVP